MIKVKLKRKEEKMMSIEKDILNFVVFITYMPRRQ